MRNIFGISDPVWSRGSKEVGFLSLLWSSPSSKEQPATGSGCSFSLDCRMRRYMGQTATQPAACRQFQPSRIAANVRSMSKEWVFIIVSNWDFEVGCYQRKPWLLTVAKAWPQDFETNQESKSHQRSSNDTRENSRTTWSNLVAPSRGQHGQDSWFLLFLSCQHRAQTPGRDGRQMPFGDLALGERNLRIWLWVFPSLPHFQCGAGK